MSQHTLLGFFKGDSSQQVAAAARLPSQGTDVLLPAGDGCSHFPTVPKSYACTQRVMEMPAPEPRKTQGGKEAYCKGSLTTVPPAQCQPISFPSLTKETLPSFFFFF